MSQPKDCPVGKPKPRRKRKNLEAPVQKAVLQWLSTQPNAVLVERRNTGAFALEDGGYVKFGVKGRADVWVEWLHVMDPEFGRTGMQYYVHVEIECKRADGKGRLSKDQKEFRDFCLTNHIPYLIVISVDELKVGLAELGLDLED